MMFCAFPLQGERGVNLSGGQKARISLARACYSNSPLVFLDDPLAAVDVPTAKHLMDHMLAGIMKDRTVILVTHNKTSLNYCDRVFLMEHGRLQELPKEALLTGEVAAVAFEEPESSNADSLDEQISCVLAKGIYGGGHQVKDSSRKNSTLELETHTIPAPQRDTVDASLDVELLNKDKVVEADAHDTKESSKHTKNVEGKLTVKEDRVEGVVTWATYIKYAKAGGGYGIIFITLVTVTCIGSCYLSYNSAPIASSVKIVRHS